VRQEGYGTNKPDQNEFDRQGHRLAGLSRGSTRCGTYGPSYPFAIPKKLTGKCQKNAPHPGLGSKCTSSVQSFLALSRLNISFTPPGDLTDHIRPTKRAGTLTTPQSRMSRVLGVLERIHFLPPKSRTSTRFCYYSRRVQAWEELQGLRMKNACEDLAHVLVVPSGYFSSSAQAVP
jgi:hypothetical protein